MALGSLSRVDSYLGSVLHSWHGGMRKAEAHSRKRILWAVLGGLALGLLVSVASLSHWRFSGAERSKLEQLQATFEEQLAQRVRVVPLAALTRRG